MIIFDRHSECQLCPLHESAKHPGLPSKVLYQQTELPKPKDIAILFVGKSPNFWEDKRKEIFVGYAGKLLDKMVLSSELYNYADIFLANACRCRPPQGGDVSQSQVRTCREYLQVDVAKLQAQYKEVVIFALGAKACYSTLNISSLNETLKKQGKRSQFFGEPEPRVFATFHPTMLHPTRKPGLIRAVETHFSLARRYLQGDYIPNEFTVVPELGIDVPKNLPKRVGLDIETYGILAGKEQTVFHPIKSKEVDGIPYKKQVVTVSFSWYDGPKLRTSCYIWNKPAHRKIVCKWFRRMSKDKIVCTGQNIKFDLLYLQFCGEPELKYWIDPRRLIADDTMIWSFLLNEQQPEKGLKELSTLYGIYDYSQHKVMSKSGNAKSPQDKNLHLLNCADTAATLCLQRDLERMIAEHYGEDSYKLSDTCAWVRNMIIWDTLDLEANGSAFNIKKLTEFHDTTTYICTWLDKISEVTYNIKLHGKGSDAPLRQFMLDCLDEVGLISDPRVTWSDKTKKISIGVENVNLLKSSEIKGRSLEIISLFQEFKEQSKIVSTYTKPILEDPRRGITTRNRGVGLAYPNWYPVPAYANRSGSSDDKAGGQIQGRFSCKKPARQTEPRSIRNCSCSRFPGGKLIEYDVSQDHLRMAALLSGDPLLMEAYKVEGGNIHLQTAFSIFPKEYGPNFKKEHPRKYTVSKNLNFLVLFRGGATAFQSEAREKAGTELDIGFCQDAIDIWHRKHYVYKQWQDSMLALAARQGYLELPTGWSRSFGLGQENIETQAGEVCNFLHQAPCAQITESAHYRAKRQFLKYNLRSVICLNIYDALFADTHPAEEHIVDEILDEAMTYPPLLPVFEKWCGRKIPWKNERKDYEQ